MRCIRGTSPSGCGSQIVVFQRRSLRPVRQSPFQPSWGIPARQRLAATTWCTRESTGSSLSRRPRRDEHGAVVDDEAAPYVHNLSLAAEPFVGIPLEAGKIVFVMALGARPVLGDEEDRKSGLQGIRV